MSMNLFIDTVALLTIFVVAIMRLNEKKHSTLRSFFWALIASGSVGVALEQIERAYVFGPDLWMIMMHMGFAGLFVVYFCCWRFKDRRGKDRGHYPDRRLT